MLNSAPYSVGAALALKFGQPASAEPGAAAERV